MVGLDPGRAPVIVAGALILETVVALAGLDSTIVSEHDILYGILLDTYRKLREGDQLAEQDPREARGRTRRRIRIGTGGGLKNRWASGPMWVRIPPPLPCPASRWCIRAHGARGSSRRPRAVSFLPQDAEKPASA